VTTPPPEERPGRRALLVLFLTVLLDLVGFGIVLPLLPLYADGFGASGAAVGLLVTVYSVAQFFMAPLWGRLSDRFGRKPILILGLLGSALAYLVFAWSRNLTWLFASRILAGVGGATIPVAEAYIADVTPPERRAGNMGLIGAAFGLGFTIGPALGGIMATLSFEAPGYLAAGLCLVNAGVAATLIRETLPPSRREAIQPLAAAGHPLLAMARALRMPDLRRVLVLYFLFTAAFAVIQPTLSLFGQTRFGLGDRQVGYLFAFLGLVSAAMQGGIVRRLVPRFGEVRLIQLSGIPFVVGLLLLGLAPSVPVLLAGLAILAVGYGGALPPVLGLVSRVAPSHVQGGVLGVGQSVGSLARIAGPLAAGFAFDLTPASPYLLGALVAAAATVLAVSLVPLPRTTEG
jgi:DHA1 family tetracycline resistance protein-like MFS transporter